MSEPHRTEDDATDDVVTDTTPADAAPEDVAPAFDVDLPPDEQGTAEAAAEQSG